MVSKFVFKSIGWILAAWFIGVCFAAFFTPIALLMRAFGVI